MAFTVKHRGKFTYYNWGETPVLSALVTEEFAGGDLRISFAGLTGGYSAKKVLNRDDLVTDGEGTGGSARASVLGEMVKRGDLFFPVGD